MKLQIISKDIGLKEKLEDSGYFEVQSIDGFQLIDQDEPKVLLISDRSLNHNQLILNVETLKRIEFVFYMLSGTKKEHEMIDDLCKANNIVAIASQQTESQILKIIIEKVFPHKKQFQNIFLFLGSENKDGTSSLALSTAEILATYSNRKVFYITANEKTNGTFLEINYKTIDRIRSQLSSRLYEADDFNDILEETIKKGNLYILPGPKDMLQIRDYEVEDIVYLLDLASKQKDFITIVDAGSNLDNPLTIAALQNIKNKFLVATPYESSKKSFEQKATQVFQKIGLKSNDFMLILNKYIDGEFEDKAKLSEIYKAPLAVVVPYYEYWWKSECDRKLIYHYDKDIEHKLYGLCNIIVSKVGANLEKETDISPSLWSKLTHLVGGDR